MSNHLLSDDQIAQYRSNGYLTAIPILTRAEANDERAKMEASEADIRALNLPKPPSTYLRANCHLILTQVSRLVRHPKILGAVSSLIGPDLLAWSAEFFIKEPNTDKIVSWHQDLTYWGLGPTDEEVTAWLALSPATCASGCMRFIPGSHKNDLLEHTDTFSDNNLLSRGQEVAAKIDEADAANIELRPGEMSLHHGRIFHASGPNVTDDRRIGLAIRYLSPNVKQQVSKRDYAMLVKGWDRVGNFIPVAPPVTDLDPEDLRRREIILEDQAEALSAGATQNLRRG